MHRSRSLYVSFILAGLLVSTGAVVRATEDATPTPSAANSAAGTAPVAAPGATPAPGSGLVTIRNAPTGTVIYDDTTEIARMTKDVRVTQAGEDFILYADDLTYNRLKNQAVATGNLRVETRDSTLTGLKIFADFNTRIITVTGSVVISSHGKQDGIAADKKGFRDQLSHKPSTLICDKVDWDYEIHQATVTGNIQMIQADNRGTCDRIIYDEQKNVSDLEGDVHFSDGKKRTFLCNQLTVYMDANKVDSSEPCTISFPRDVDVTGTPAPAKTPVDFGPPPDISPNDVNQFNTGGTPTPTAATPTPAATAKAPAKTG